MGWTNVVRAGTNANLVEQQWSNKVLAWTYKNMWIKRFLGTVIHEDKTLEGFAGDRVTKTVVAPLVGAGKTDSQQRGDGGEALVTFQQNVDLHAYKHEAGYASNIVQQRTKLDLRSQSKDALGNWNAQLMDDNFLYCASGLANTQATIDANAPSTARKLYGGEAADATAYTNRGSDNAITTAEKMGPFTLERAKRLARRLSSQNYPKIAPIMWEGKEVYLLIVSDEQLRDFRATNRFNSGMYYSEVRGKDNPLFSGAEFMWDGVVVYCWEKILKKTQAEYFENGDAVNTGVEVHRALFLGANAITLAWGKNRLRWSEEDYWHGDGWSAGIEAIYGMAKTEFNGYDFGVITVDTAAASDA